MPKQSNHKSMARQWAMLQLVPTRNHGLSAAEICKILEENGYRVSKRTVERDLQELSDFGIETDDSYPRRWSWQKGRDNCLGGISVAEEVSLAMVENHLRVSLPKAMLSALEGRFIKAQKFLSDYEDNNRTKWPQRVAFAPSLLPLLPPKIDPDVLHHVQQALMDGLRIDATYTSMTSGQPRKMVLHPLGLIHQGQSLYLVATANEHEDPVLFALHRLGQVALRNDKIIRPRGFKLADYVESGAAQFGAGEPIVLKAQISNHLAVYLTETPLAKDQQLKAKDDGFILTATVRETWQLRFWILSQGEEITVLQPKKFRESIRSTITNAAANYAAADRSVGSD